MHYIYTTDPNSRDYIGRTALHCACKSDNDECVKLVQELLGRYMYYKKYRHLLIHAHTLRVSLLYLYRNSEINVKDEVNYTPLHYAAEKGHSAIVALLLDKGAELDASDSVDDTPVHKAAEEGHVRCVCVCALM